MTVRPPRLHAGDTIGIFTPSVPAPHHRPRRFERGVAELVRLGFRVRVAEHARAERGYVSGTVEERVADLHDLFADEDVHCILAAIGGFNSNSLLERLDYGLIAANSKPFVGYSDVTALHAALWTQTQLAVTLGPSLLVQFGEYDGIDPYTWSAFERTLMSAEPAGRIEPSTEWTAELLEWDVADHRRRIHQPNAGPRAVREGLRKAGSWPPTCRRCSSWPAPPSSPI